MHYMSNGFIMAVGLADGEPVDELAPIQPDQRVKLRPWVVSRGTAQTWYFHVRSYEVECDDDHDHDEDDHGEFTSVGILAKMIAEHGEAREFILSRLDCKFMLNNPDDCC